MDGFGSVQIITDPGIPKKLRIWNTDWTVYKVILKPCFKYFDWNIIFQSILFLTHNTSIRFSLTPCATLKTDLDKGGKRTPIYADWRPATLRGQILI
jgi:hypothetical protein